MQPSAGGLVPSEFLHLRFQSGGPVQTDRHPVTAESCKRRYARPEPQNQRGVTRLWQVTNHSMLRSFLGLSAGYFGLEGKVHL